MDNTVEIMLIAFSACAGIGSWVVLLLLMLLFHEYNKKEQKKNRQIWHAFSKQHGFSTSFHWKNVQYPKIWGRYKGTAFEISVVSLQEGSDIVTGRWKSGYYTRIIARPAFELPSHLNIYPRSNPYFVPSSSYQGNVEMTDPELDSSIYVLGSNHDEIRQFIHAVREPLLNMVESIQYPVREDELLLHPEIKYKHEMHSYTMLSEQMGGYVATYKGIMSTPESLTELLDTAVSRVAALDHRYRDAATST